MSTDTIKNYDDQDDLKLACPACIEGATIVKGEKEVLSNLVSKNIVSISSKFI
jgi:hypothetical protein